MIGTAQSIHAAVVAASKRRDPIEGHIGWRATMDARGEIGDPVPTVFKAHKHQTSRLIDEIYPALLVV